MRWYEYLVIVSAIYLAFVIIYKIPQQDQSLVCEPPTKPMCVYIEGDK